MEKLKPKEQKIYDYIVKSMHENGYAPSVRDICRDLGYKSTSTVHMYLNRLDMLGYIVKEDGKSRAVTLVGDTPKVCAVPLLGVITAGQPILAEENREGYVGYAGNYATDSLFALRVKGESMIEAGILDGDIIIAEKTCYAESGEIVVALIEDEATVKRLFRRDGQIWLMPENELYEPIDGSQAEIIGVVKAVVREY